MNSGGIASVYDFENHLVQKDGVTMVYDGDGNRVQKVVAGITTKYLVASINPTGYAQVVTEAFTGASGARELSRSFVYGLERISQYRVWYTGASNPTQASYYVYDGHGSVRALTDTSGNVTDTYDYDAFGNLIHSTFSGTPVGSASAAPTPNEFLFAGEQFDSSLNLYYNRARYLNVTTGRFWTMDAAEPAQADPVSLHRYLYADADPVNALDPSGLYTQGYGTEVEGIVGKQYVARIVDAYNPDTGVASEVKSGYVQYSGRISTQISKDAELLANKGEEGRQIAEYVWRFYRSPYTGRIGADPRILQELTEAGIKYVFVQ